MPRSRGPAQLTATDGCDGRPALFPRPRSASKRRRPGSAAVDREYTWRRKSLLPRPAPRPKTRRSARARTARLVLGDTYDRATKQFLLQPNVRRSWDFPARRGQDERTGAGQGPRIPGRSTACARLWADLRSARSSPARRLTLASRGRLLKTAEKSVLIAAVGRPSTGSKRRLRA